MNGACFAVDSVVNKGSFGGGKETRIEVEACGNQGEDVETLPKGKFGETWVADGDKRARVGVMGGLEGPSRKRLKGMKN